MAVDSFLIIGGLLTAYRFLKHAEDNKGVSRKTMIVYYLHRFWRLWPLYIVGIVTYSSIAYYVTKGPFARMMDAKACWHYWWTNLLFINNIVDTDKCMAWTWYLAVDTQLHILAPVVLLPLALGKRRVGMFVAGLLVVLSSVLGGALHFHYDKHILEGPDGELFTHVYVKPWSRMGAFAIGMLLGYFLLASESKLTLPKWGSAVGWTASTGVALTVIFLPHNNMRELKDTYLLAWSKEFGAVFEALSRPLYVCCVGWVILACATGHGGYVNKFLSWKAWKPLSKLTFATYLIHVVVFYVFAENMRRPFYFSFMNEMMWFPCIAVLSYMTAFLYSTMVECPANGLEKIFRARRSAAKPHYGLSNGQP